ncbi:MAG: hypothetical protein H7Y11_05835 [Armatimonadetes bacterium]|nr:hypothetical protein [Anaerolineae bacterium]
MTIWAFSALVSRRLWRWNVINMVAGALLVGRTGFWRGFGSQNLAWGVINIAIAVFGTVANRRRLKTIADPLAPQVVAKETHNLRRLLLINAGLDVVYMLGGWRFAASSTDAQRQGVGWGIVLQGALLLIFDVTQAAQVPNVTLKDAADDAAHHRL